MKRTAMRVAAIGMMTVAVLATGCSGKKKTTGVSKDGDVVDVGAAAYNESGAMGPRFEQGTRVTDATFQNVLFAYNQYTIEQAEIAKIDAVAKFMQDNADVSLVAEGNCDERGTAEYNLALGENRAQAVRAYMISVGVDGNRIQTRSYGEERPINPGHTEAAWRENRRVEFALYR